MGRKRLAALRDRARSSHQLTTCGAAPERQPSVLLFSSVFPFPELSSVFRVPPGTAFIPPQSSCTALYGFPSGQGMKQQVPTSSHKSPGGAVSLHWHYHNKHIDNYLQRRKG